MAAKKRTKESFSRYDTVNNLKSARISILEGISRGELAIAEGRVVPHADARKRMARWLK